MLQLFVVFYLFLASFGHATAAENHPACGTGRPVNPPLLSRLGIVGGEEAIPHEFPWQIRLYSNFTDANNVRWTRGCGGSILNEQWILTAAHCLLGEKFIQFRVSAGKHRLAENGREFFEAGQQVIKVHKYISHPRYHRNSMDYDIAVLKLEKSLAPFPTPTIGPICLPEKGDLDRFAGQRCIAAGWGAIKKRGGAKSNVLKKTAQIIWKQADCTATYRRTNRQFCFAGTGQVGNTCMGDSGGPVVCLGEMAGTKRWMAVGIASFGFKNCADINLPSGNTRVSELSNWVWEQIDQN